MQCVRYCFCELGLTLVQVATALQVLCKRERESRERQRQHQHHFSVHFISVICVIHHTNTASPDFCWIIHRRFSKMHCQRAIQQCRVHTLSAQPATPCWQHRRRHTSACHSSSSSKPVTEQDRAYMRQALQLAQRGLGHTHPNPAVGCVIVKDGQVGAYVCGGEGRRGRGDTAPLTW